MVVQWHWELGGRPQPSTWPVTTKTTVLQLRSQGDMNVGRSLAVPAWPRARALPWLCTGMATIQPLARPPRTQTEAGAHDPGQQKPPWERLCTVPPKMLTYAMKRVATSQKAHINMHALMAQCDVTIPRWARRSRWRHFKRGNTMQPLCARIHAHAHLHAHTLLSEATTTRCQCKRLSFTPA